VIVLIGFMGAGKTSVGELLARRLGIPFMDTDDIIAGRTGATVAEIFASRGEPVFRELERDVTVEVLTGKDAVVSLGGGALGDPSTDEALSGATVVHLFVDFAEAMRRVGGDPERPLLANNARGLYGRRLGTYEVAADEVVQTDDLTPDEVVQEIMNRLHLTDAALEPPEEEPALSSPAHAAAAEVVTMPPASAPGESFPEPETWADDADDAEPTDPGSAEASQEETEPKFPEPVRVRVPTPSRHHEVVIGAGLVDRVAELVPLPQDAAKAFVITHPTLLDLAGRAAKSFEGSLLDVVTIEVPEGETSKSLDTATHAYKVMAAERATRHDVVVGVGGGVVTDLAGFIASTFNRGMALVQVPTTLLGQVDAAIGGKTGVNLPEGKNKVGTFHQPVGVVCDIEALNSLPEEEMISGMAEVVKYGLIADGRLLETVLHDSERLRRRDAGIVSEVVARSVTVKAEVVTSDETDSAGRAVLNYGHTIGHAIENIGAYRGYRHGEAIAIGMMAASYIAQAMWDTDDELVSTHADALAAAGLPTRASVDPGEVETALAQDKKFRRGARFVLLRELARPETDVLVPADIIRSSIERLGA
jgi:shikimate kinase / 3-dehydroquinate synthase